MSFTDTKFTVDGRIKIEDEKEATIHRKVDRVISDIEEESPVKFHRDKVDFLELQFEARGSNSWDYFAELKWWGFKAHD